MCAAIVDDTEQCAEEADVNDVFVVDACRTPIGKIKGVLADMRPDHLAADVITALVGRSPWLDVTAIDDVYWGAANQAGEDNRNVARMSVLLAGLPVEVPGATVNRLCGSGMEAVCDAARTIAAGEADVCLAGGSESMTRAPFVLGRSSDPFPRAMDLADTRLGWRLVSPRMKELYPPITLGETAENVADKYGITRERQDQWALRSHRLAAAARDAGRFDAETAPVTRCAHRPHHQCVPVPYAPVRFVWLWHRTHSSVQAAATTPLVGPAGRGQAPAPSRRGC